MAFDGICHLLSPTPYPIFCHTYAAFFQSLGPQFLVGGDWNAKHTVWGARLITPKGRTLPSVTRGCHCTYFGTGEPTYSPTDQHRIPDLLDFLLPGVWRLITCGSSQCLNYLLTTRRLLPQSGLKSSLEWFPTLVTHNTDWNVFRAYITDHINLNLRIKQCSELDDATHYFTTLQEAAWHSTHPLGHLWRR